MTYISLIVATNIMNIFSSGPELKFFLEPLNLHEKKLIVLAVNNNASSEACGGSHW